MEYSGDKIKKPSELQLFLTAIMFYTRIPVSRNLDYREESMNRSIKYFPLVGWIVGGFSALVFIGLSYLPLPHPVVVLLSMAASVWLTGAFHEDGFADMCDGFGGGWTKEKILAIMKDSRLGTYGAIGLFMLLLTKFFLLLEMPRYMVPFAFIAGHSLSRLTAASFLLTHRYVREGDESKAKPVAKKTEPAIMLVAALFGLLPLLLFQQAEYFLIILPVYFAKWLSGRFFTKWIGGYTGDCLGATQQLTEVIFYLFLYLLPWMFT